MWGMIESFLLNIYVYAYGNTGAGDYFFLFFTENKKN